LIVATRLFTIFCTFQNEFTSIWRTRSRETPNSEAAGTGDGPLHSIEREVSAGEGHPTSNS
jgi:hypothetical protein